MYKFENNEYLLDLLLKIKISEIINRSIYKFMNKGLEFRIIVLCVYL